MKNTPDFTGRKTLHFEEDAQSLKENEYQNLFEISPNPTWIFDVSTHSILQVNQAALHLFGYTRQDFLNLTLNDLVPDVSRFVKGITGSSLNSNDAAISWKHKKKDGSLIEIPLHCRSTIFQGRPVQIAVALVSTEKDIIVRQNKDQQLRLLIEQLPQILWTTDCELRFTSSTGAALAGLKLKPNQTVGMTLFEYFKTDDPDYEAIVAHRRALFGEATSFISEWMGRTFQSHVEPLTDQDGKITGTIGVAIDITEHKLVEKKLREAEAKLRNLVEGIPAITYIAEAGRNGQWVYVSPQIEKILGYTPSEWTTNSNLWIDHVFFADRDRVIAEEHRCIKTGESFHCEYRITDKNGVHVWVRDDAVVVSDPSGKSAFLHGVLYDISDRKHAEEAVRESEQRLRMVLDTALDAVITIDSSGVITGWNKQAESLFGWNREEAVGKLLTQTIIPKRYREAHRAGLQRFMETGKSSIINQRVEVSALHRKGHEIMVELSISPMQSDKSISFSAFLRDITENKKSQTQQAALYQIAEKANLAEDLQEFYRAIHNIVGELIQAKNFYIALLDSDSSVLTFPYFVDEVDSMPEPRSLAKGLTEYVLRTGQAELISPARYDELARAGEVESVGTPSVDWLGVPLKAGDKAFGVLVVQSYTSGRRFGEKEKEVLTFVSQHIASTLERKRSEETIRHQAYHDALTKLPNRVLFRDRMTQALAHAQRRRKIVAMMFLDLDRFKIINDTLGHAVGDKLLQGVAHRLRECLRKEDTVARLGGDEFMLLLSDVNHIEDVARIAEKVLNSIRPPFQIDSHELYINTSIGISLYPHDGEDA
ncbi:MAG TPA: PAS domain S-box protein, partial [Acidobacteriota bacterium]|nr:PAS domain S-box protein [Acidobacteriota bacterium]